MARVQFTIPFLVSTILVQYAAATSVIASLDGQDDNGAMMFTSAASSNPSHPSTPATWTGSSSHPTSPGYSSSNAAWTNGTAYGILDWLPKDYSRVRVAHATMACVAWLVLFPLGGIIPRLSFRPMVQLVPLHMGLQMFAYTVFVAAAGMGIWMAKHLQELDGFHPIIGMAILVLLSIQPLTEILNAIFYSPDRHNKIIVLGHIHIWLGRALLTAGLVNGGLGFLFADTFPWNSRPWAPRIIYAVAALMVWVIYMLIAVVWPHLKSNGFRLEDLRFSGWNKKTHRKPNGRTENGMRQGSVVMRDGGSAQRNEMQRPGSVV